jgi:hypothetical protein
MAFATGLVGFTQQITGQTHYSSSQAKQQDRMVALPELVRTATGWLGRVIIDCGDIE